MDKNQFWKSIFTFTFIFFVALCGYNLYTGSEQHSWTGLRVPAARPMEATTGYNVYRELLESSTTMVGRPIFSKGKGSTTLKQMEAGLTFGAEKEGSSSLITRVAGPTAEQFQSMIQYLSENDREKFLRDFFKNWMKNANGYRTYLDENGTKIDLASDVKDIEGNPKTIDIEKFRDVNFDTATLEELETHFKTWLEMTDERPFSFIKPTKRRALFNGHMPGLSKEHFRSNASYYHWKAHFGDPEKYIMDLTSHHGGQGGGWEIRFKPQNTYAEFEQMVIWFRKALENQGQLFQRPGHQWLVFVKPKNFNKNKFAELMKMTQALIVVDGIKGGTGIESSHYKSIISDRDVADGNVFKQVLSLENDYVGQGTMGIEFRAGTKDINTARFLHNVVGARVSSNDFSGMANWDDWTLVDDDMTWGANFKQRLIDKYGFTEAKAEKIIEKINSADLKKTYIIPLWNWTDKNNPFLSDTKKVFIDGLTKDFFEQILQGPRSEYALKQHIRDLMKSWARSANLSEEIRRYMRPKREFTPRVEWHKFKMPTGRGTRNMVDVNKIDLGIEYSGKFPIKLQGYYTEDYLADLKKGWIQTQVDLTSEERKTLIKKIALDLEKEFGKSGTVSEVADSNEHGHGLDVAFELKDSQNRTWRVEWDGIGRTYTPDGHIIEGSSRGGSIELVTPKFSPEIGEIDKVYKAFEMNDIIPYIKAGGGHVNVDLAAFDGNPKAMARFLGAFLEYRGVISTMFQHIGRLRNAEPIEISDNLMNQLKNFEGTEEDLKKLLYNERYFNSREGRKTRYIQLDLSAYFQDVIPEEFISQDFDIASPVEPWRRQFRVDPKIRKGEFRLFNAPKDTYESALQMKLVKALLHKALNTDKEIGNVDQKFHEYYIKNPQEAFSDMRKMCVDLGIDFNQYRIMMAEGLAETKKALDSEFFMPLEQRLRIHKKAGGWGEAVDARSADEGIASEGRPWHRPQDFEDSNIDRIKQDASRQAERARGNYIPTETRLKRNNTCMDALNHLIEGL